MSNAKRQPTHEVEVGQTYADTGLPRHEWRVREERDGCFVLERTDKSGVFRFQDASVLSDPLYYRRVE